LALEPGDIVVVFTGYKAPTNTTDIPSFKTISREAAEYLAGIPVRAFATDALSADSFEEIYRLMAEGKKGYQTIAPVHHAFLPRGIPIIEQLVNLEELSSEDNAVFVGLPLKVRDGDGSPIRAAAFVY
jgi:kynurenine formamidase